ncbi:glycerophosphodiester phosphodiesterase family protein [Aestuariibaculum sediminum]|uniref:Glycerophosphodiester phosphodiesterase family protein n=1 Tax=Aestuariibaculum sediminum TaxID=2770637 RepID=A0A8J6QMK9_9FLAO|nr:glycerophosphodiester phosphodiesterase family protein [Aestuariibaculum sediminum]MBD0833664.1 glycerophosphodiester phosphodiesterase family protein [Aestuariibaculum sediminum]
MRYFKLLFGLIVLSYFGCKQEAQEESTIQQVAFKASNSQDINQLIEKLEKAKGNDILVAAHRGDWRNSPENSLQAIQYCIDMGVDIVEIDVMETKDGELILMHDKTVNRTTKAKGLVKDFTLDSIQQLVLTNGIGGKTSQTVPTLKDALLLCKGKILVNLDKSYDIFYKCLEVVKETGTLNQVIFKGVKTFEEVEGDLGKHLNDIYFMPIINLKRSGAQDTINKYLKFNKPIAFEINTPLDTFELKERFSKIRAQGSSVWMNALWPSLNGGHDDEKAMLDNSVYDWYIENNVNIIQTDRPQVLLNYLREKGKHN